MTLMSGGLLMINCHERRVGEVTDNASMDNGIIPGVVYGWPKAVYVDSAALDESWHPKNLAIDCSLSIRFVFAQAMVLEWLARRRKRVSRE